MNKLFIDTNIFESKGFNFDQSNILIKLLIENAKNKNYEYYNLSVIDKEIISHITDRCNSRKKELIGKFKWIKHYVKEKDIDANCNKELIDYENFKKNILAVNCSIEKINPEKVFNKYFKVELPFELKKEKKNGFPDAFISEYLNDLSKKDNNKIYFISNDNGLVQSLDKSIMTFKNITSFFREINSGDSEKFKQFAREIITAKLTEISSHVLGLGEFNTVGLEDEEIDLESIQLSDDYHLEILESNNDELYVNCTFKKAELIGSFSCLDYENSYWPNGEDYYTYTEYFKTNKIEYENYEVNLKIYNENDNYKIEYDNLYSFSISYENIKENAVEHFSPFDDYDGEDSWSQDGHMR